MKGFIRLAIIGFVGLTALLILPQLTRAQQYKPGANFWGDCDNALINGPDEAALKMFLAGIEPGCWPILPDNRLRTSLWFDLDGNGFTDAPDLAILETWAGGDFSDLSGNPVRIEFENQFLIIAAGNSVEVAAKALSQSDKVRPGWGMVFEIMPTSTCTGALIYGRYVWDGRVYGYFSDRAFEYTAEPAQNPGDDEYTRVKVLSPSSCAEGSTIEIEAYLPADSEFGVSGARMPERLTALNHTPSLGGDIRHIFITVRKDSWITTSRIDAPSRRANHTAVWTENEMIIWGGENDNGYLRTGGRYNPITDTWIPTSTTNAPSRRVYHTAVWTGTEMIVWGGDDIEGSRTGGSYNPTIDSWIPTSTTAAPSRRTHHTAVWTGAEMIVWGGSTGFYPTYYNSGGRYNPVSDSWTATSTGANCPSARDFHTAVWTGIEMIIWGGGLGGARYNPVGDSWIVISRINAPELMGHTAVWTGIEMIIWGTMPSVVVECPWINPGGRYNPLTDSWILTPTIDAPIGRWYHTAVWTGSEMIVWGGVSPCRPNVWLRTGGKYKPTTDTWVPTSTNDALSRRANHTAVWTGNAMIIWGGYDGSSYLRNGGIYWP